MKVYCVETRALGFLNQLLRIKKKLVFLPFNDGVYLMIEGNKCFYYSDKVDKYKELGKIELGIDVVMKVFQAINSGSEIPEDVQKNIIELTLNKEALHL